MGLLYSLPKRYHYKLQAATTDLSGGRASLVEKEAELPEGMNRELMPKHVAMIMDGNRRWARQRGLRTSAGHEAAVKSLRKMVKLCRQWVIQVVTVFAFSSENWIRPKMEVSFLLSLFERSFKSEMECYLRYGIRVPRDSSQLPTSLQKFINEVKETSKNNTRLQLIVAISYSDKYPLSHRTPSGDSRLGDVCGRRSSGVLVDVVEAGTLVWRWVFWKQQQRRPRGPRGKDER
ncbi:Dehydrodolichyl diphosphate synthase 2 [Hibiscus syriacus]|uniref:Alkyl transferase n=1 Tax=Hibiscus syriacus TaxID=106335 RepID=A0A6A2ZJF5_HIBSY|nr:Dehydrodolichyl diphosphate synthase 2 [Hibiscus syriacus]